MIPMTIQDVARAIGAEGDFAASAVVRRVVTNSRDVVPGDLFFALRGERFDGHRFVEDAQARGAVACVCASDDRINAGHSDHAVRLIVEDTVAALGQLAAHYRREVLLPSTQIIAVTGSNGKTTTKLMLNHVLKASLPGRASLKSYNNHIGVPLTLLAGERADQYIILEIGTSTPGEVAALAAMAAPDVVMITSVGAAHLEGFGDVEAVAQEKASLLDHVRRDGLAVVNVDHPALAAQLHRARCAHVVTVGASEAAALRVTPVRHTVRHTEFTLSGVHRVTLPLPGFHHAANAASVFAVADWFGVSAQDVVARLASFCPPPGRAGVRETDGVTIVDDAYNANPASMKAAIKTLRTAEVGAARRIFVMGDMFELGEAAEASHASVIEAALEGEIDVLVVVGEMMAKAADVVCRDGDGSTKLVRCADAEAAGEALRSVVRPGDIVWIKGSRAMGLERAMGCSTVGWSPSLEVGDANVAAGIAFPTAKAMGHPLVGPGGPPL